MDMTEEDVKLADMPPDILSKIVKFSVSRPLHHMMLHSATQGLENLLIKNINQFIPWYEIEEEVELYLGQKLNGKMLKYKASQGFVNLYMLRAMRRLHNNCEERLGRNN